MILRNRFRRWKCKRNNLRLEIVMLVRAVAKRFVVTETASAKRNGSSTGKIKLGAVLIEYLKITLYFYATIAFDNYFGRHVTLSLLLNIHDFFFFDMRKYEFFDFH